MNWSISYLFFPSRWLFTYFHSFFVISLGAIGFEPNTFSSVSSRPAKDTLYPPNAFFFLLNRPKSNTSLIFGYIIDGACRIKMTHASFSP